MKRFFLIAFIFINFITYANDSYLKLAENYEKDNNTRKAIENYKLYLKSSNDNKQKEKIELKIARISENYRESVAAYKQFFESYPKSEFLFLAKYELASLHKLNNNYKDALTELYELAKISKGTPYWQKSMVGAASVEYLSLNYKKAKSNINDLLNEIDEYEDLGTCYFLMGKIMDRLNDKEEAKEYFLICAGSFPQSTKAPTSLLELLKLYLNEGKNEHAKKTANMIGLLYSESPENVEAKKITKNIKYNQNSSVEVELINLNSYENKSRISSKKLSDDLKLSLKIVNIDSKTAQNSTNISNDNIKSTSSGIYLQLGYFSLFDNAKQIFDRAKEKNVNDLFIMELRNGDRNFYRVLIGPFDSPERANERLIELKEKNIEAINTEITRS